MMPLRFLVVVTTPEPDDELLERLDREVDAEAEMLVVAPSGDASFPSPPAGESDFAAVERALCTFEADELIVVTRAGDDAAWLGEDAARAAFERFGGPIRHVVG
jgi:hypothetical protein